MAQKFNIDDTSMDFIFDLCTALQLPVLTHTGDKRQNFSSPKRIRQVIRKHPKLILISAHFGGYTVWEESIKYLVGEKVFFDTSSTLWSLPLKTAQEMIENHGVENFFFGSDFPMWDHTEELQCFNQLYLIESQRQDILYNNAAELLKIGRASCRERV